MKGMDGQGRFIAVARRLIGLFFRQRAIPTRSEAGAWLWYRPVEYPSLLLGMDRMEPEIRETWRMLLRDNDVIYDVGANIGVTVHRFRNLLQGRGQIVAFEPAPRNLQLLERNCRCFGETVTVVNAAVADYDGEAVLSDNLAHGGLSRLAALGEPQPQHEAFWKSRAQVPVKVVTLDTFAMNNPKLRATFLKLDVEGAGHLVLDGAKRVLHEWRPIVSCSFHTVEETAGVRRALTNAGYRGVRTGDGGLTWCDIAAAEETFMHPEGCGASLVRRSAESPAP